MFSFLGQVFAKCIVALSTLEKS